MSKTIETLIKDKGYRSADRWYPTSVDSFRNGFKAMWSDVEGYHPLVDNIAYSLQYLQFIEKELRELELSNVIYVMLVKTYVITGMSIIEGIFSYIIKSNGWWKMQDEDVMLSTKAQIRNSEGEEIIVKTEISKKIEPYTGKMTLDEMIKCLNKHHSALKIDHIIYPQLNRIRDLRNRVHLQKGEDEKNHDYNAFDFKNKKEMQEILYAILCSPNVTDSRVLFHYDFLKSE